MDEVRSLLEHTVLDWLAETRDHINMGHGMLFQGGQKIKTFPNK